jgi:deazaflavin-dependent oxidoreductase (nitroreductase family)
MMLHTGPTARTVLTVCCASPQQNGGMGLMDRLNFDVPTPNTLQRVTWKLSSSRPGAWLFSKSLHHMDALVLRATNGRTTLPEVLSGLPVITLATTGARTGARRETPLVGVPSGDNVAVIGTSFGQRDTPGWYFNLRAQPRAEIVYKGTTVEVAAREAEGQEREDIWSRARQIYAGYEAYAQRIHDRPIHIMVLEPTSQRPGTSRPDHGSEM